MLMLALAFGIATLPADTAIAAIPTREISLSARYRRALILGLEREIGGKFVITGLAGAPMACGKLGSCVSGATLSEQQAAARVTSYGGLLELAHVSGEQPLAIVSLRSAREVGDSIEFMASVYQAGHWQVRRGVLKEVYMGAATTGRLQEWSDVL